MQEFGVDLVTQVLNQCDAQIEYVSPGSLNIVSIKIANQLLNNLSLVKDE